MIDEKNFLKPGDLVKLRLDIPNAPVMLVYKIERTLMRDNEGHNYLRGVRTRWFTDNGFLQEAVFSTKDLLLVE